MMPFLVEKKAVMDVEVDGAVSIITGKHKKELTQGVKRKGSITSAWEPRKQQPQKRRLHKGRFFIMTQRQKNKQVVALLKDKKVAP